MEFVSAIIEREMMSNAITPHLTNQLPSELVAPLYLKRTSPIMTPTCLYLLAISILCSPPRPAAVSDSPYDAFLITHVLGTVGGWQQVRRKICTSLYTMDLEPYRFHRTHPTDAI
ncbi:hypothetical protein LTR37_013403 [Vermiconidia calcicola]|uniref:Uncharacterized protein n=1 Tax=Vermiconidia calcicola TaxID=1690605 RepID=A0ACC3MXP7_9PEZI|nr:hypothetical protein LTR37_013403 [Vermiconidia calcicola]